jgi:hypothetical protein|tara:strand:+ start:997 stop:1323 length:327 start_codon:yes stop_codon:yes gene_type:complete
MGNRLGNPLKCFVDILHSEMVLTNEVIEPKLNSGVLLLFVIWMQNHFLLHIVAHFLENLPKNYSFFWLISVHLFEIVDHRWDTLNDLWSDVLGDLLFEKWASCKNIDS